MNLDIFWSREKDTVEGTFGQLKKAKKLSEELGLRPSKVVLGPWEVGDQQGMQVAIELLRASQGVGRNDAAYLQFDSIRKIRSAYANAYEASPLGMNNMRFKGGRGQAFNITRSPTDSVFFQMFMKGCEKRMGRLVKQELGLAIDVLLMILSELENELFQVETSPNRRRDIVISGAAFACLYGGALRGGEILLTEGSELIKRRDDGKNHPTHPHVVLPLMGRFKGETGERNVLLVLANKTQGGLEIRRWLERLIELLIREGREGKVGPAFCDRRGFLFDRWRLNGVLRESLKSIQARRSDMIGRDIDVDDKFSIHRSFRRGATTRAKELKVPEATIEMNNRWRKVQNRSGGMPNLPMSELYVEITQALGSRLRFSESL